MPLWTAGAAVFVTAVLLAVLMFGQPSCYRGSREYVFAYVGSLVLTAGPVSSSCPRSEGMTMR